MRVIMTWLSSEVMDSAEVGSCMPSIRIVPVHAEQDPRDQNELEGQSTYKRNS